MTQALADGRFLVLASTSTFRRELLARLALPFTTHAPEVDETASDGETAPALVSRLAAAKAQAVATAGQLVIGSDQVAELDGQILGKPGDHNRAVAQLQAASGRTVQFFTGLALVDGNSGRTQTVVEPFRVHFRPLQIEQIERYLRHEQPYNCAGSFKSEGLGITLFERLEGDDPHSLIGLPLIQLTSLLHNEGIVIP